MKNVLVLIILAFLLAGPALADEKDKDPAPPRSKNLNFGDELLEGMNSNPLDLVEDTSKKDGLKHPHLYRKKLNFRKEMGETAREAGYLQ